MILSGHDSVASGCGHAALHSVPVPSTPLGWDHTPPGRVPSGRPDLIFCLRETKGTAG
jgi:hypothetical protein